MTEDGQYNPRWMPLPAGACGRSLVVRSAVSGPSQSHRVRHRQRRGRYGHRRSRANLLSRHARGVAGPARPVARLGYAPPAHAHPPRPRRGDRHDPAPPPRDPGRGARTRRAPPGRSRRSCSTAPRGCTATRWTACGAKWRRCRSATWWSCRGGETVAAGGRAFDVAYTPGHASHHVCYFDRASGVAVRGRHRRRVRGRRLRAAADAAARHRRGTVAREPADDRALGRVHAVPHALRPGHQRAYAPPDAGRQPAAGGGVGSRVSGDRRDRRRAPGAFRGADARGAARAHAGGAIGRLRVGRRLHDDVAGPGALLEKEGSALAS